jgi:hypothetical protein
MRICALTMSIPVTTSVTVCSTCRRGLTSMKKNRPERGGHRLGQLVGAGDDPHPPAAAAPAGLDHEREAHAGGEAFDDGGVVGQHPGGGHDGHARRFGHRPGGDLVGSSPRLRPW